MPYRLPNYPASSFRVFLGVLVSQAVKYLSGGLLMRGIRFCLWISFVVLLFASAAVLLVTDPPRAWAQLGTPPSSTISSSSGPLAWDFGPVGGGTVINVGIQDICPPGLCDDHDLTVVLPAPA